MFQVGDLIVYGNTGVCRVEKIGRPDLAGVPEGVDYYTLSPYYSQNSKIFTPCDNEKVVMRPVISKKEARKLVREIPSIQLLIITDEKKREVKREAVIYQPLPFCYAVYLSDPVRDWNGCGNCIGRSKCRPAIYRCRGSRCRSRC